MDQSLDSHFQGLQRCMHAERDRLRRALLDDVRRAQAAGRDAAALPIAAHRAEIARALAAHQVVIVCGATGSGKTTQLPQICLDSGRGVAGMIGHTQPRRIAARSVAARIAAELGVPLGRAVGYKVRFSDRTHPDTFIKLMTDGTLLAEIQSDRRLAAYDTLIIDEAHERSLNIDFLLGYLRRLLPRRPELKLVITSATIEPRRFAEHFGDAPVIEVSGRGFPVEIRYRPPPLDAGSERDLPQAVLEAVGELVREGPGDILVFLSGERDIREAAAALRKHHPPQTEILPLYARLGAADQQRVFAPHAGRRIVLATNVAETALTVPGVRYVIDSGLARISRYHTRSRVQRLPVEPISRASAEQRAGRCGRTSAGICIRLYGEDDFLARTAHTPPEIRRTNLASVILQMGVLDLGPLEEFPFIDPPDGRYVRDGYRLLFELGALDGERRLTPLGRRLARLPVDPRIGRMILAAERHGCLGEALVVAAALSIQDPRERPADERDHADERHRAFQDECSDFMTLLNLWRAVEDRRRHLSQRKLRAYCRDNYLSYRRLEEWRDIHQQLKVIAGELGLRLDARPAEYAALHQALLAGLLGQVAVRGEDRVFSGAHGNRLAIFPGSALARRPPKWIMAAEIVETSRLYAHTVAHIEPEWLEEAGGHLLRRSRYDPFWDARSGRVMICERATLYGLTVYARRRVDYAPIAPAEARELFIRCALVEGDLGGVAEFLQHNLALAAEVADLEARLRRTDLLAAPAERERFYAERLPAQVCDRRSLESWLRHGPPAAVRGLYMDRANLLSAAPEAARDARFPDHLAVGGVACRLDYRFAPGEADDGVTLNVPLALFGRIDAARLERLVPGRLPEKLAALIRTLPKRIRRHFAPAADYAVACQEAVEADGGPLAVALGRELRRIAGIEVADADWRPEALAAHLHVNVRVLDERGAVLDEGRDLARLRHRLGEAAGAAFRALPASGIERAGIRRWDFGGLPEIVELVGPGGTIPGYPALVEAGEEVLIRVFESRAEADAAMACGVRRLFMLSAAERIKSLRRNLPGIATMCLDYAHLGSCEELREQLIGAAVARSFPQVPRAPRTEAEFARQAAAGVLGLGTAANRLCALTQEALAATRRIRRRLTAVPPAPRAALEDIRGQLEHLVPRAFLTETPSRWLDHLPRYLRAVEVRLIKLERDPARDAQRMAQVLPFWRDCLARLDGAPPDRTVALVELRWLIEEFRVSVFAQELGTAAPVSAQRLVRLLERL